METLTGLMVINAGVMVGSAVVMLGGTVPMLTQPQWIDKTVESYFTTIYDIKTEMKEYYFCIRPEEVANVVKRGKVVFKVKSNPMESVKDDDWQVRRMAIEALGSMKDSHSAKFLISALSDKSFVVRTESARNLGELKDVNAVEPLLVTLKDDDWPAVRVEVARALGKIKDIRAVEPLITALKDEHLNTTQDTIGLHRDAIESESMALSEITGKNFGYSYIAWQEWWEQNKDIFLNSR